MYYFNFNAHIFNFVIFLLKYQLLVKENNKNKPETAWYSTIV